jgi:hypothetical protein
VRWIQEHPRRAVAAFLVAFVVVLAAVGVGGALGGDDGPVQPARASEARTTAGLSRELVQARDRAARAERQVADVTDHAARWRDRALRAENAAKRAERRAASQHTNRKSRRRQRR